MASGNEIIHPVDGTQKCALAAPAGTDYGCDFVSGYFDIHVGYGLLITVKDGKFLRVYMEIFVFPLRRFRFMRGDLVLYIYFHDDGSLISFGSSSFSGFEILSFIAFLPSFVFARLL
jgi:hypothetical protein